MIHIIVLVRKKRGAFLNDQSYATCELYYKNGLVDLLESYLLCPSKIHISASENLYRGFSHSNGGDIQSRNQGYVSQPKCNFNFVKDKNPFTLIHIKQVLHQNARHIGLRHLKELENIEDHRYPFLVVKVMNKVLEFYEECTLHVLCLVARQTSN